MMPRPWGEAPSWKQKTFFNFHSLRTRCIDPNFFQDRKTLRRDCSDCSDQRPNQICASQQYISKTRRSTCGMAFSSLVVRLNIWIAYSYETWDPASPNWMTWLLSYVWYLEIPVLCPKLRDPARRAAVIQLAAQATSKGIFEISAYRQTCWSRSHEL